MSQPKVFGWRSTTPARDQIVPKVMAGLAGVDCEVYPLEHSLDVDIKVGNSTVRVCVEAAIQYAVDTARRTAQPHATATVCEADE